MRAVPARSGALLVSALLLAASTAWCEEAPGPVQRAEQLVKSLDVGQGAGNPDSTAKDLERADLGLRGYLQQHPEDAAATVLLMTIYGKRVVLDTYKLVWMGAPGITNEAQPYSTILDRALQADPQNAALHYWRGRLYAIHPSPPNQEPTANPLLAQAIQDVRRAVALDPKEESYRATLAYLLLAGGDLDQALTLYQGLANGTHPMYLLLRDWKRVPEIEGSVSHREGAFGISETFSALAGYAGGRFRYFTYRGPAQDFEAKCRKLWPSFRLVVGTPGHGGGVRRGQHLHWNGAVLEPDLPGGNDPGIRAGGIWVEVEERLADQDPARRPAGIGAGDLYCAVQLRNERDLP
jgi:tetratricopeptide (TPR) repeat protein